MGLYIMKVRSNRSKSSSGSKPFERLEQFERLNPINEEAYFPAYALSPVLLAA
jgi:hypothetical protein